MMTSAAAASTEDADWCTIPQKGKGKKGKKGKQRQVPLQVRRNKEKLGEIVASGGQNQRPDSGQVCKLTVYI